MQSSENIRGIVMMLLAMGFLSCMDAGLKHLAGSYEPLQVVALRSLASLPFIAAWALTSVGARALLRVRWPLHVLRGLIGVGMLTCFVYAVKHLPLTTAYAIFFVAPLIITAMSAVFLGDHIGAHRWIAIAAGFTGVMIAMRPTGEGVLTWYGLAVLGAATGYAVAAILVRVLARTDSTQSMVFWMLSVTALGATVLALPNWTPVRPEHWWLVFAVGLVGALGGYAITEAFARGEPSVIAPFEYTALAWGLGFDLAIWGVLPDAWTWAGAAIIVGSGIYLMRRERAIRRQFAARPEPAQLAP